MPYLHTVPPEDAAGEVKAIYDQELAARGYVANYARVQWPTRGVRGMDGAEGRDHVADGSPAV